MNAVAEPQKSGKQKQEEPEGLEGWLIVVGSFLVLAFICQLYLLVSNYLDFSGSTWVLLAQPGTQYYNPAFKAIIIMDLTVGIGLVFFFGYLITLFLHKKRTFPFLFSTVLICGLCFSVFRPLYFLLILGYKNAFDPLTCLRLLLSAAITVAGVLYMKKSRRVRNTFTVATKEKSYQD